MKGTKVCVSLVDVEGGERRGLMTFAAHMELLTIRCIWRVRAMQAASTTFGREGDPCASSA